MKFCKEDFYTITMYQYVTVFTEPNINFHQPFGIAWNTYSGYKS